MKHRGGVLTYLMLMLSYHLITIYPRSEFVVVQGQTMIFLIDSRYSTTEFVLEPPFIATTSTGQFLAKKPFFDSFSAFSVHLPFIQCPAGRAPRRAIKSRLCTSPLNFCRMKSTRQPSPLLPCHSQTPTAISEFTAS